jgi:serine/threonine-protein kinase RsbW
MTCFEAQIRPQPLEISDMTEQAGVFLERAGVDTRATHHVTMILEELLTNLATHGGVADERANVSISIETGSVLVEITDAGPPFDPRSTPDPDTSAPAEDRVIGGLGLFLMRKLASNVNYVRDKGRNRTAFTILRS